MFQAEQKQVESITTTYFNEIELSGIQMQWTPTPFAGQWGITTSFFQAASQESKQKNVKSNVPLRAQEMAQSVAERIHSEPGFDRVEAVRGYLNLYFKPAEFARRVVDEVLIQGGDFGRGQVHADKIMVEYANLNTHKAFHVGI